MPIVARGGGLIGRLKAEWTAAVGEQLAAVAWPATLGRDGALKLLVAPGAALELQHRAPLIIDRVNRFLGRDAVARIVIVQRSLPRLTTRRKPAPPPLAADKEQALDARLSGIDDVELRDALAGLGRLVLGGDEKD